MAFYDKFPYTNFQEINLDRIIKELMQVKEGLNFVIENSSLKYADPIEWNITKQYQANTVVIDPATGIAYLSTKPVPNNILVTNTNYWTKIFDLSQLFDDLEASIASEAEAREQADTTLQSNIDAEETARENADTTLQSNIDAEATARENADNALSARIDDVAGAAIYINVKDYGAAGDGATIDTEALRAAFNAVETDGKRIVYFPAGTYLIDDYVNVKSYTHIMGNGATVKTNRVDNTWMKAGLTLGEYGNNSFASGYDGVHDVLIENLNFDFGYNPLFTASTYGGGNLAIAHCKNITIRNCNFYNQVNEHHIDIAGCNHVIIENCTFKNTTVIGSVERSYEAINIDWCSEGGFPHFGSWDNTACRDIIIQGCAFEDLAGYAYAIGSHYHPEGAGNHVDLKIINNVFRSVSAALKMRNAYDCMFSGNQIINAGYFNDGESETYVIWCRNCPSMMIEGNTIRDTRYGAIKIENEGGTDTSYVRSASIINNIMMGINSTSTTGRHAIRMIYIRNALIQNNIIYTALLACSLSNIIELICSGNTHNIGTLDAPFTFNTITNGSIFMNRSNRANIYGFAGTNTGCIRQGNAETAITAVS